MSTGRSSRSAGNDARSDARERALHLLYEAHAKSETGTSIVESQVLAVDDLVLEIVHGVDGVTAFADEIIAENAIGWTLARMPVIDLIVLRIAIFELKSRPDVPTAVILNEAVELAKTFSTDESGRFVNGILSTISKKVRQ
ncbi:MAG: transcription antitermination protein NusB [Actinomycetota bacterium]|jgi:N utilization substance protein B